MRRNSTVSNAKIRKLLHNPPFFASLPSTSESGRKENSGNKKKSVINNIEKSWELYINKALYAMRNRKKAATDTTSSELLLGYTPPRSGTYVLPEYQNTEPRTRDERIEAVRRRRIVYERNLFPEKGNPRLLSTSEI